MVDYTKTRFRDEHYGLVYQALEKIFDLRPGLSEETMTGKVPQHIVLASLAGQITTAASRKIFTVAEILDILNTAITNKLERPVRGEVRYFYELLPQSVQENEFYNILERILVNFKPGNSQAGPGEFLFVFWNVGSTFITSARTKGDIILSEFLCCENYVVEMKKKTTQKTGDLTTLEAYRDDPDIDGLIVINPATATMNHHSSRLTEYLIIDYTIGQKNTDYLWHSGDSLMWYADKNAPESLRRVG